MTHDGAGVQRAASPIRGLHSAPGQHARSDLGTPPDSPGDRSSSLHSPTMSHTASFPVNEEAAFARRYLDSLAAHSVNYADDYVTPPQKRPRRMPVVGVRGLWKKAPLR